jgi:hypothetical protein
MQNCMKLSPARMFERIANDMMRLVMHASRRRDDCAEKLTGC